VIIPNKSIVVDIGSGTGFLSLLASKMGAKQCNLIEMDQDMIELSKQLAKRNKISNFQFIPNVNFIYFCYFSYLFVCTISSPKE
jgi:predicted RNA methylase